MLRTKDAILSRLDVWWMLWRLAKKHERNSRNSEKGFDKFDIIQPFMQRLYGEHPYAEEEWRVLVYQVASWEFINMAKNHHFEPLQSAPQSYYCAIHPPSRKRAASTATPTLFNDALDDATRDSAEESSLPEKDFLLFEEGTAYEILATQYERDEEARKICLSVHGFDCAVCNFNFEKEFGSIGRGFIHVHHLTPLSEGARQTDPAQDLRPVCPNCHAIIHRRQPPLSIEEVRALKSLCRE